MKPSRRSVLAAGLVGVASACTPKPRSAPTVVSPDEHLRTLAADREEAMLQLYNRVLNDFPGLAPELQPLRAQHEEHRRRLGFTDQITRLSPATLAGRTAAEAKARLAALEKGVSVDHGANAVTASRALAPLLASLSASEACHAAVL